MASSIRTKYAKLFDRYLKRNGEEIVFISAKLRKDIPSEPDIWKVQSIVGRTRAYKLEGGRRYELEVRFKSDDIDQLSAINSERLFPKYRLIKNLISHIVIRNDRYNISDVSLNTFDKLIIVTATKEG